MLKDFSSKTLAQLINERIGEQYVVVDPEETGFPQIHEHKRHWWIFERWVFVAKIYTESGVHVTMVVGNPTYGSLVNRLATLLMAEFKTINRNTGEPGSIVVDFLQDPIR